MCRCPSCDANNCQMLVVCLICSRRMAELAGADGRQDWSTAVKLCTTVLDAAVAHGHALGTSERVKALHRRATARLALSTIARPGRRKELPSVRAALRWLEEAAEDVAEALVLWPADTALLALDRAGAAYPISYDRWIRVDGLYLPRCAG